MLDVVFSMLDSRFGFRIFVFVFSMLDSRFGVLDVGCWLFFSMLDFDFLADLADELSSNNCPRKQRYVKGSITCPNCNSSDSVNPVGASGFGRYIFRCHDKHPRLPVGCGHEFPMVYSHEKWVHALLQLELACASYVCNL